MRNIENSQWNDHVLSMCQKCWLQDQQAPSIWKLVYLVLWESILFLASSEVNIDQIYKTLYKENVKMFNLALCNTKPSISEYQKLMTSRLLHTWDGYIIITSVNHVQNKLNKLMYIYIYIYMKVRIA